MVNICFIGAVSKEWMGGLNYFKNLLYALSTLENKEVKVFVFVGKNTDIEIKNMFKPYATLIESSIFDKKKLYWYINKVENILFKTNYLLESILKKYNIQVLSHSGISNLNSIKTINWIPDFQHLHLPDMFLKKEVVLRNTHNLNLIQNSDRIVLSSYDALKDFKTFAYQYENKVDVLQFVSQADQKYFYFKEENKIKLLDKYDLRDDFFYIPNQFWKHKNHMLAFEAVKLLVDAGNNICLVCTGHLLDYRNKEYINEIQNFIKINNLENNIRLLGLVDYEDVFLLIKFSKAVINPSLFEGWSSTVEECKSVGKNMILSDLDVHKEQYPDATFFQKDSKESLKDILINYSNVTISPIDSLEIRTEKFAKRFVNIVKEVVSIGSNIE